MVVLWPVVVVLWLWWYYNTVLWPVVVVWWHVALGRCERGNVKIFIPDGYF